ncbi:MAG: hypothetical protein LBM18_02675 [Oscillospiraceae bacterium]|jgi:uncharacterized membrane protein|nr:hypothetical protein [Oscillospiraceae bacterium]
MKNSKLMKILVGAAMALLASLALTAPAFADAMSGPVLLLGAGVILLSFILPAVVVIVSIVIIIVLKRRKK